MDVPLAELLTRLVLAVVVTGAFGAFLALAVLVRHLPERWVVYYLTAAIGAYAAWRWFVLWLGSQPETPDYQVNWEPAVRAAGSLLLVLIFTAVMLIAMFRVQRIRKSD